MKLLITGAKGIVASELLILFNSLNISVNFLTRTKLSNTMPNNFYNWDPDGKSIDTAAFEGVSAIIHLAGASIADHNWSNKYKQTVVDSRVKTSEFLLQSLRQHHCLQNIKHYITASAIGFYPDPCKEVLTEQSPSGEGFLSEVCRQWEGVAQLWAKENIAVSAFRIGLVLSDKGGLLRAYQKPAAFHLFPVIGSAKAQWSWVHVQDLCRMMASVIRGDLQPGTYNAVAPNPVSQKQFMKTLAAIRNKRPALFPPIPSFLLKAAMGERSKIITTDQNVSAAKLLQAGFVFKYPKLDDALRSLFDKKQ